MITKLNSLTDIANEFGTPLSSAGNISWYYANKNPYSEVQPVMGGGRIKDWIGYDHSAVNIPEDPTYLDPNKDKPAFVKVWFEPLNPKTRTVLRFFFTTPNNPEWIRNVITDGTDVENNPGTTSAFIMSILMYGPNNSSSNKQQITTKPVIAKYNTDKEYMIKATGTEYVYHCDCKPKDSDNFISADILDVDCTKVSPYFLGKVTSLYINGNKVYIAKKIAHTLPHT